MKTHNYLILPALLLNAMIMAGTPKEHKDSWLLLNDYALTSRWNSSLNSWFQSSKEVYLYGDNFELKRIISLSSSNDTLSRVLYEYDENGSMTAEYYQDWISGAWVDRMKYLMDYDEYHRRMSLTILFLTDNEWVYSSRQSNFTYDDRNLLSFYNSEYWTGTGWQLAYIDSFTYDDNGSLIYRISKTATGGNYYRIYYFYNQDYQRTRMLVQYYEKLSGLWQDTYRDTYLYDACGKRINSLREVFINGSWINSQKTDLFYKVGFYGHEHVHQIPVCHNNHTIFISPNALNAHLKHGDCIGQCKDEKTASGERSSGGDARYDKPPFTVYPNPAGDNITIKLGETCGKETQKLELIDYNGKILKEFIVAGNNEIIFYRESLPAGNYYLKLTGDKVYTTLVVFE
jgi:hypothetical protein